MPIDWFVIVCVFVALNVFWKALTLWAEWGVRAIFWLTQDKSPRVGRGLSDTSRS